MPNTLTAALPPGAADAPGEPTEQLEAVERDAMTLLRLIAAAGLTVGLLGLTVTLLG